MAKNRDIVWHTVAPNGNMFPFGAAPSRWIDGKEWDWLKERCLDHFGPGGRRISEANQRWTIVTSQGHDHWCFRDEEDLTMFLLIASKLNG